MKLNALCAKPFLLLTALTVVAASTEQNALALPAQGTQARLLTDMAIWRQDNPIGHCKL